MNIIRIEAANLAQHLDDLIVLSNEFLKRIGSDVQRDRASGRRVLEEMVANAPTTVVLKIDGGDAKAIGVSYYNYGTGFSGGGAYLWLNCIYIRDAQQRRGYASQLLDHIVEDGRRRGIKLFICNRDPGNEASRRLFARAGFTQHESVIMTREFE